MSRVRVTLCTTVAAAVCLAVAPHAAADLFANPFASFESRCEALPAPQFQVITIPVSFTVDDSVSLRTLSRMNDGPSDRHRTVGLTKGQLAYDSTLESKGIEDRRGARVCSRPSVTVVLKMTPMTVYIARELAQDKCRRPAVLEHEMKHVAVYREYLGEVARDMREELPRALGTEVVYGPDAQAAQAAMRQRLQAFMRTFMQNRYAELRARQAAVDTPEEYARLSNGCGPLPAGS
jgi:hypothetical protein